MSFLIYGAYGYTGTLIARAAVGRGMTPTLAGRDDAKLGTLAEELEVPYRTFELSDAAALDAALDEARLVLHCAGPFVHTAAPMVEGCLRTGTDYLDITGEIQVFEMLAALDDQAQAMDAMLLPGVGFDVVPSDGLAAHLHARLPSAEQLALAIFSRGGISRGTATSAVEHIGRGGAIRRNGHIQQVPLGWRTRTVDFGRGPVEVTAMPWGDVATAYRSTGIPNITTYMRLPKSARRLVSISEWLMPVLATAPVQRLLKRYVQRGKPGPTAAERERGASVVWGEAIDEAGGRAVARLHGPDPYDVTVDAALTAVQHVLDGEAPSGYQTPSTAFGADFALEIDGITREDVD